MPLTLYTTASLFVTKNVDRKTQTYMSFAYFRITCNAVFHNPSPTKFFSAVRSAVSDFRSYYGKKYAARFKRESSSDALLIISLDRLAPIL